MSFSKYISKQSKIFTEKVFKNFNKELSSSLDSLLHLSGKEIRNSFKHIHHSIDDESVYKILVLNKNIVFNKNACTNVEKDCDFVIGRKYKSKNVLYSSAFDILVKGVFRLKINKDSKTEINKTSVNKYLKQQAIEHISKKLIDIDMERAVCIDLEYINDIHDTYTDFPVSQNHSHIFMIGCQYMKNDVFNIFTKPSFNKQNEYSIILEFLDTIQENTIIIHWSHADKTYLLKSLERYPDLMYKYDKLDISYIDLMKIFKECEYPTWSYSLKVISKDLLNYQYNTKCLDGIDAITACIYDYTNNLDDVINYNKQDTILLKKLIQHCL